MMPTEPYTFASLIGQHKAKSLFCRAIAADKVSHSYLLRGPAGVGKKRAAMTFAARLNCLAPVNDDACGTCRSCHKFASHNHPDLSMITADGVSFKINQIRALKKELAFPPFESRYRIVILGDIQNMTREAANSLLKTLEEPPDNTVLLLTVDEAADTLNTIVSRCQTIPFLPLPPEAVAELLRQDNPSLDHAIAHTASRVAAGSIGQARLLLETGLITLRREIVEALCRFRKNDSAAVEIIFSLAEKAAELKAELPALCDLLALWLRDAILIKTGEEARIVNHDLAHLLPETARRFTTDMLLSRLTDIETAKNQLARNCNRPLVCEVLFFGLL